jgi:hypothetical protein
MTLAGAGLPVRDALVVGAGPSRPCSRPTPMGCTFETGRSGHAPHMDGRRRPDDHAKRARTDADGMDVNQGAERAGQQRLEQEPTRDALGDGAS